MKKKTMMGVMLMGCMMAACSTSEEKRAVEAVRVETETVKAADAAQVATTYVGEVEAASSTAVSFTGSGTVTQVLVSDGQRVRKGQLLAVMDDTQSRNAMMAAEAMMMQAQDAYDRMKVLHERQSISEMDWVEVQSRLKQAQSSLEMTKKAIADCQLQAPCSGIVGSRMMEAGMTALPAQPVCNILDISTVKIKVSVPEKEVTSVADEATLTVDALGGMQFRSKGVERGVTADAISRTYDVRYLVDNREERLLPGMVCSLSMQHGQASEPSQVVTVPITSVQRKADGGMFVWTVSDGHAHRTPVTVGRSYGNRICLTNGIGVGDVVVVKGYQKLNEGNEVK